MKRGFTLLEVLAVVIIIGILASLAYSSLVELIQINKAKEASRLMTAFIERAITEGKMRKQNVTIYINANSVQAIMAGVEVPMSETFSNGFSTSNASGISLPFADCTFNVAVTSAVTIGFSGISGTPCFAVCNPGGYCGGTVKEPTKNHFTARIKKKNSNWEDL
jgi:prepilin-type N-terminal cleavage/methylation domain-containing protein